MWSLHCLIMARQLPGDRKSFEGWLNPPDTAPSGVPRSGQSYAAFGDYDFLLHRRFPVNSRPQDSLSSVREMYSGVLDDGLDARLTLALEPFDEGGGAANATALPDEGGESLPLVCVTLIRINEGFLREARMSQLICALNYVGSLCDAVEPKTPRRVLLGMGMLDLVLIQWGRSYDELYRAVRLLRISTLDNVRKWALAKEAKEPIIPRAGDGVGCTDNHLCNATYSMFSFRWDADATLDGNGAPSRPARSAPRVLVSYNAGHEWKREEERYPRGENQPEGDLHPVEIVGIFDRMQLLVAPDQAKTENEVILRSIRFFKGLFLQERGTNVPDYYRTNTLWTLTPPSYQEMLDWLVSDGQLRGILAKNNPDAPHRSIIDTDTRLLSSEPWGVVFREIESSEMQEPVRSLLRQLQRVYQTFNVVVRSEFLYPAVADLYDFLRELLKVLPHEVRKRHEECTLAEFAEILRDVIKNLTPCLSHRLNFTTLTFKHELPFFDGSSMHKVLLGFTGVGRKILKTLREYLKHEVHLFCYVGALRRMESDVILETGLATFLVVRVDTDNLFNPQDVVQFVHEVAHHLYFISFDTQRWLRAYLQTVAVLAATQVYHEVFPGKSDGKVADLKAAFETLLDTYIAKAVPNPTDVVEGIGTVRRANTAIDQGTRNVSFSDAFGALLQERSGDIAELVRSEGNRANVLDILIAALRSNAAVACGVFTETVADLLCVKLVGFENYDRYLESFAAQHSGDQEEFARRRALVRASVEAKDPDGELADYKPLVEFLKTAFDYVDAPLAQLRRELTIERLVEVSDRPGFQALAGSLALWNLLDDHNEAGNR